MAYLQTSHRQMWQSHANIEQTETSKLCQKWPNDSDSSNIYDNN